VYVVRKAIALLSLILVVLTVALHPGKRNILVRDAIRCADKETALNAAKKLHDAISHNDESAVQTIIESIEAMCTLYDGVSSSIKPAAWIQKALYEESSQTPDFVAIVRVIEIPPIEKYDTTYLILLGENVTATVAQQKKKSVSRKS